MLYAAEIRSLSSAAKTVMKTSRVVTENRSKQVFFCQSPQTFDAEHGESNGDYLGLVTKFAQVMDHARRALWLARSAGIAPVQY